MARLPVPSAPALRRPAAAGFTLLELLVTVSILGTGLLLVAPPLLRSSGPARVELAAIEVSSAFQLARSYAVRHSAHVAVAFERDRRGVVSWRLYRDGDGDGVRRADIRSGVDPAVTPPNPMAHLGRAIRFGFPPGARPRDPGDPRKRLAGLDRPLRFGNGDLASFGPLGSATPGSAYLTDGARTLVAVRTLGATGRVHVTRWDDERDRWF